VAPILTKLKLGHSEVAPMLTKPKPGHSEVAPMLTKPKPGDPGGTLHRCFGQFGALCGHCGRTSQAKWTSWHRRKRQLVMSRID